MRTVKRMITGFIAVVLVFAGCNICGRGNIVSAAGAPTAAKSVTVVEGKSKTIVVKGANIKSKSFKSTNPKIAAVSKNGKVSAKKAGSCKIQITVKYLKNAKAKKTATKVLTTKVTVKELKKSKADVAELKKIFEQQKALGVTVSAEYADENAWYYVWADNGRLEQIQWAESGFKGKISFSVFAGLKELDCGGYQGGNQIEGIDVSGCRKLRNLVCHAIPLKQLNLTGCTALRELECSSTQLEQLDLSDCTALKRLNCSNAQLTELDVKVCKSLESLTCGGNRLTKLDVSACENLEALWCDNGQLEELNASGCTKLSELFCGKNQLTELNLSGCAEISYLDCKENKFTEIDLTGCSNTIVIVECDKAVKIIGLKDESWVERF